MNFGIALHIVSKNKHVQDKNDKYNHQNAADYSNSDTISTRSNAKKN